MPKFVPVVDTEKSIAEQVGNSGGDFDKHRQWDAPHSVQGGSSKKVDRGWQQGNVGWGVLGSFGSSGKDDAAQVVSRSEGSNKMVKNEKGLWVKAKEVDEGPKQSAGRGGGVSILQHYQESQSKSRSYLEDSDQFRDRSQSPPGQVHDEFDYKGKKSKLVSDKQQQPKEDQRRSDYRGDSRDRGGRRRDSRSPDSKRLSKSREDSRDRDRRRDSRDNRDHRDSHGSSRGGGGGGGDRRQSGRERSRSRSYDRRRDRREYRHGDKEEDGGDDRKSHRRDRERRSRSRSGSELRHRQPSGHRADEAPKEIEVRDMVKQSEKEVSQKREEGEDEEVEVVSFDFTAIQVVNHFHEVFAQPTPSDPSRRITAISELFDSAAYIASLKNENNVYLRGREAVGESFLRTTPSVPVISKRLFIDSSTINGGGSGERVTFCLDLHRAGTAPGLGDSSKDGLLLYRCVNSRITSIWGMADAGKMASDTELTVQQVLSSPLWANVVRQIVKDIPSFLQERDVVYHNYDHMEVWG